MVLLQRLVHKCSHQHYLYQFVWFESEMSTTRSCFPMFTPSWRCYVERQWNLRRNDLADWVNHEGQAFEGLTAFFSAMLRRASNTCPHCHDPSCQAMPSSVFLLNILVTVKQNYLYTWKKSKCSSADEYSGKLWWSPVVSLQDRFQNHPNITVRVSLYFT